MAIRNATIALDFDGTVVTHEYPHIGEDAGAVPVLKELVANGYRLILHTMRHGALLEQALGEKFDPTVYTQYLEEKYGELYGL